MEWSDGHLSPFSVPWLVDRAFTQENVQRRREEYDIEPRLWGKGERIRRHQYEGIMGSEDKLLAFLTGALRGETFQKHSWLANPPFQIWTSTV